MSAIMIRDLAQSRELDRKAMSCVRGGNASLAQFGPFAKVNVNINQNIAQLQNVEVNALNNVGVIGFGFVAPKLDVSPTQFAGINTTV